MAVFNTSYKPISMKSFLKYLPFLICFLSSMYLHAQEYGVASFYDDKYHGKLTASGELYDKTKFTAAHNTLPYNTIIEITRLDTKQSVRARVNDRGPYIPGRIVDLSKAAAEKLNMVNDGTVRVKIEVVDKMTEPTATTDKKEEKKDTAPKPTPTEKTKSDSDVASNTKEQPKSKSNTQTDSKISSPTNGNSKAGTSVKDMPLVTPQNYQQYDLYKITLNKPSKTGFGVQVISLTNYENVFSEVAKLQGKFFDNILLNVVPGSNGQPVYKIILGPFDSRAAAENYQKDLKRKKKINGFVVPLSDTP